MAGRVMDLALHLLDRQVVDTHGEPVGKVDDVELSDEGLVTALLVGPQALAGRIGGVLGELLLLLSSSTGRRSTDQPVRVGVELVTDFGTQITVSRSRAELGAHRNEDRVRDYVVSRIPGADRARG